MDELSVISKHNTPMVATPRQDNRPTVASIYSDVLVWSAKENQTMNMWNQKFNASQWFVEVGIAINVAKQNFMTKIET